MAKLILAIVTMLVGCSQQPDDNVQKVRELNAAVAQLSLLSDQTQKEVFQIEFKLAEDMACYEADMKEAERASVEGTPEWFFARAEAVKVLDSYWD